MSRSKIGERRSAKEPLTFNDSRVTNNESQEWRLQLGTTVTAEGVRCQVWAPQRQHVDVWLEDVQEAVPLQKDDRGYFAGFLPQVKAGVRYRYRLDGEGLYPDPCSRYQPEGPHGPSLIVDPRSYAWHDGEWPGVRMHGQVMYELHIAGGRFRRLLPRSSPQNVP